jgi:hypothetical protein
MPENLKHGEVISKVTPEEMYRCKYLHAVRNIYHATIDRLIKEHAKSEIEMNDFWHDIAKKYLINEDEKMFIDFDTGELKRG